MDTLIQDLRHAVRSLRKSPGFTAIAVLTLGLGIGASTAVFSVVNAVLVRPLPFEEPDRLVFLWNRLAGSGAEKVRVSTSDVIEYREQSRLFEDFAAVRNPSDAALTTGGDPERLRLAAITTNFFQLLGVDPVLGRAFVPEDAVLPPPLDAGPEVRAPPRPLIVSHALWQRRFGGDADVVGRVLEVNGRPEVIVGVMPAGFELHLPPDVGLDGAVDAWTPLVLEPEAGGRELFLRDQDSDDTGAVIGRLEKGVTLAQAQAEMDRIAVRQRETSRFHRHAGTRIDVTSMHDDSVAHARPVLMALFGAVGFVLLIACMNVANLLLARATNRRKELSLKIALGASRARIFCQMLTEGALLAVLACSAGVVLAAWGIDLVMALRPGALPRMGAVRIDGSALGFSLGVAALAALLATAVPAFAAGSRCGNELLGARDGGAAPGGRSHTGAALVVSQIALSLALLTGTGLMLKSMLQLLEVDPGFSSADVLTFDLTLRDPELYRGPGDRARFAARLEERLSDVPGVQAVGLIGGLPLSGTSWSAPYGRAGQSAAEWSASQADFRVITPGFFEAMGTRLVAGRTFTMEENRSEDRRVVIIDRALARRIAAEGEAIGARLGFPLDGREVWAEVVGVVERVRYTSLRADGREALYVPYRHEASRDVSIVVRTSGDPMHLAGSVRRAVRELDPALPVYNLRTMDAYVADAVAPVRFAMLLLSLFAGLALILASVGLYGLLSYTVSSRTREIGVRMALGARRGVVAGHVLRRGMLLVAIGMAAGVALSLATSRVLSGLLYDVSPIDPLVFASVALVLLTIAALASCIPARRAAAVDPMVALRHE